ncbi:Alpha/Beta hydrolase protein [Trichoderma ceciliae]
METPPETKITITTRRHTSSFILLHENDASAAELGGAIVTALTPARIGDLLAGSRLAAPDAPFVLRKEIRNSATKTMEGGFHWVPSRSLGDADDSATPPGWRQLAFSMNKIGYIIEQEAQVVGRENVFLLGFGGGFAAAAAYVLQMEDAIGGFLGIHPWLPFHGDLKSLALYGETMRPREQMSHPYGFPEGDDGNDDDDEDEEEPHSGASTPTLCAVDGGATTSEAMLQRVAGCLNHLVSKGKLPASKRVYERVDSSTPVILVHGADDQDVDLSSAKETLETLRKLGFNASLKVMDGHGHTLSRHMLGALFDEFMMRRLGNEWVRESIGEHLQGGWL